MKIKRDIKLLKGCCGTTDFGKLQCPLLHYEDELMEFDCSLGYEIKVVKGLLIRRDKKCIKENGL